MPVSARKVLVVGTTGDYIAYLDAQVPGRLVFLTDMAERARSAFRAPEHEILADLSNAEAASQALMRRLPAHASGLSGLTCYDCESLPLAARLAHASGVAYPSPEAIAACRDKYRTNRLWQAQGIACAAGGTARSPDEARRLFAELGPPVILKPRTGSGGAFMMAAASPAACVDALLDLQNRLAHSKDRLYASPTGAGDAGFDAKASLLIEARVDGQEFSADFIVDGDVVTLLRTSRKISASGADFGETLVYVTPAELDEDLIAIQLRDATHALGLRRAFCTADFIRAGTKAVLLEIAPRPGGDCLPRLVRHALGRNILRDAIDFAEGLPLARASATRPLVGLMLRAALPGTVEQIDASAITADPRTVDCVVTRCPGDRLGVEGPADRVVGEVIFAPRAPETIEQECRELRDLLRLRVVPA